MRAYLIRRIFLIIPTLVLVTIIVFLTVRFIPGSVIEQMAGMNLGEGDTDLDEIVAQIRHDLGMDVPIWEEYLRWMGAWPKHEWGWSAEASVSDLSVTPGGAGTVTVRALVTNTGDTVSDYKVKLKLNDETLETKKIVINVDNPDTTAIETNSTTVYFTASSSNVGTYSIEASGYSNFTGVLQGSLGNSIWTGRAILPDIISRVPISLELGIIAIVTGLLIAFPVGIYSAIRQDSIGDYVGRSFAIFCMAVPGFWLGTMVWAFPSVWWDWTPATVYIPIEKDFLGNITQFIIPGVLMGMVMSGVTMRMTRTMMLEVLRQDYIRTAWSKGLRERVVVIRHALKNAMIPVITIIGLQLPVLIGGTVIMESIFNLPGMGRYMLYQGITLRDYPIVSGTNLMMGSVILVANLLVDMTYGWLDPRVRYR
ncbi:MAG TPA: ABC transporter permease [Dehalococcoidia bacterium]|nr:ABC transporter permease [Dehalococcoidia bacterium]